MKSNRKSKKPFCQIRPGFNIDEAIVMATISKYVYEVFSFDDKNIKQAETKDVYKYFEVQRIYKSLCKDLGWRLVHTIRNDYTNIRGLILKNSSSEINNQYVIVLRGSSVTDDGAIDLDNIAADVDWDLVDYKALCIQRAKVVKGFNEAFDSIADEIKFFFKCLRGELKPSDFDHLVQLSRKRRFACITALIHAGGVLYGEEFQIPAEQLISQVVADCEVDNDREMKKISDFIEDRLICKQSPLTETIQVWTTGHSLGGSLCQLSALALRRWFGTPEDGGLKIKVYAIAACKIGNKVFVDYYNELIGKEMSYRIENILDTIPSIPLDPLFPVSSIVPDGIKLGNIYLARYFNGGEVITVQGFGNGQSGCVSVGGLFNIPFSVPFPHSPETYIDLLQAQKEFWSQLFRPFQDITRSLINEVIDIDSD
jgi:hypothetical protein